MPSRTEIANKCFVMLGQPTVTNILDSSGGRSEAYRALEDMCRKELLHVAPWRFATHVKELNQLVGSPDSDFGQRYQMPKNPEAIQIITTNLGQDERWAVFGDEVHCDRQITVTYTADVGVDVFSPLAASAMAHLMASNLAMPAKGNRNTAAYFYAKYQDLLDEAAFMNEHHRRQNKRQASLHDARRSTVGFYGNDQGGY